MNRRSLRVRVEGKCLWSMRDTGVWRCQGRGLRGRLASRAADGLTGPLTVTLQSQAGSDLAKGEVTGLTDAWKWSDLSLTASETDPKARLCITATGQGHARGWMWSRPAQEDLEGPRPSYGLLREARRPQAAFLRFRADAGSRGTTWPHEPLETHG